jgi:hypothetical protein
MAILSNILDLQQNGNTTLSNLDNLIEQLENCAEEQAATVAFITAGSSMSKHDAPRDILVKLYTAGGQPLQSAVEIDVEDAGGTAQPGVHYTFSPPSVEFLAGSENGDTRPVTVTPIPSALSADKTAILKLNPGKPGTIAQHQVEILGADLMLTPGLIEGVQTLAVFMSNNQYYVTGPDINSSGFDQTTPDYDPVDLATLGMNGNFVDFVADPWSPMYLSGEGAVNGWILSTQEVRRIEDVFGSPSLGTAYGLGLVSGDVVQRSQIHTNIAAKNFVVVQLWITNSGTPSRDGHYIYRTTNGTSWTGGKVSSNRGGTALWVSAHQAGVVFATDSLPIGSGSFYMRILKSSDYGASFPTVLSNIPQGGGNFWDRYITGWHFPYHDNADDDLFYFSMHHWEDGPGSTESFRYDGGTVEEVTPFLAGGYQTGFGALGLDSDPEDPDHLRGVFVRLQTSNISGQFAKSEDGAETWDYDTPLGSGVNWQRIAVAGDNAAVLYTWGFNGALRYSADDGETWQNKAGNLPNGTNDHVIRIVGG